MIFDLKHDKERFKEYADKLLVEEAVKIAKFFGCHGVHVGSIPTISAVFILFVVFRILFFVAIYFPSPCREARRGFLVL